MSLYDFKLAISKRYETFSDNIIVFVNDVPYEGKDNENKLLLSRDIGIDEDTVVKIEFKNRLLKKR